MTTRTTTAALLLSACTATLAPTSSASASWPTSPDTPLILGNAPGAFGPRQSAATSADDQSVWLAWQDSFCIGDLRIQRIDTDAALLAPLGLPIQPDPTCGFLVPPHLAVSGNSAVVARFTAAALDEPPQAFSSTGVKLWTPPPADPGDAIANITALSTGNTLIAATNFRDLKLRALAPDGTPAWPSQLVFPTPSGSNFRIFSVVPEPTGGAFIFWDSPTTYTRTAFVQRVTPEGTLAWPEPVRPLLLPPLNGLSRHTDPAAIPAANGDAWFIYTDGRESGFTTAPLRLQRLDADGNLAFPIEGHRVSLGTHRQFHPSPATDPATGDLYTAWLDGVLEDSAVRVQRLAQDGSRLWTDLGIHLEHVPPQTNTTSFHTAFWNNRLTVTIANESGIRMHAINPDGSPAGTWTISNAPAASVRVTPSLDGAVVTWHAVAELFADGQLVAQRVNPGGRLGAPACNQADLAEPLFVLDLADLNAFISAFTTADTAADLAAPLGVLDLADVQTFIAAFSAGCP